jgi:hypothetical protein
MKFQRFFYLEEKIKLLSKNQLEVIQNHKVSMRWCDMASMANWKSLFVVVNM